MAAGICLFFLLVVNRVLPKSGAIFLQRELRSSSFFPDRVILVPRFGADEVDNLFFLFRSCHSTSPSSFLILAIHFSSLF